MASLIFRSRLTSPIWNPTAWGKRSRASCCVIVLAPAGRDVRRLILSSTALTMSLASLTPMLEMLKPMCRSNPPSSAAMIASRIWGDVVVADDETALHGEFADHVAARGVHARDGVRRVVIERGNLRQVSGVREQDAAQDTQERDDDEQRHEARVSSNPNDVVRHQKSVYQIQRIGVGGVSDTPPTPL